MIILEGIRPVNGYIDYSALPVTDLSLVSAKYNEQNNTFTVYIRKG